MIRKKNKRYPKFKWFQCKYCNISNYKCIQNIKNNKQCCCIDCSH